MSKVLHIRNKTDGMSSYNKISFWVNTCQTENQKIFITNEFEPQYERHCKCQLHSNMHSYLKPRRYWLTKYEVRIWLPRWLIGVWYIMSLISTISLCTNVPNIWIWAERFILKNLNWRWMKKLNSIYALYQCNLIHQGMVITTSLWGTCWVNYSCQHTISKDPPLSKPQWMQSFLNIWL